MVLLAAVMLGRRVTLVTIAIASVDGYIVYLLCASNGKKQYFLYSLLTEMSPK